MSVIRRTIFDLVVGDTYPPIPCRFPDLDLSSYSKVEMIMKRTDGRKITRSLTLPVSPEDLEVGTLALQSNDLIVGRHSVQFKFYESSSSFRLPKRFAIIFDVKAAI